MIILENPNPIPTHVCRCKKCSCKFEYTENDIKRALLNQNFIPMVDERGIFIGIVTRRRLAQTLSELIPE